jgi:phenylacetate-CoA ligase
VAAPVMRTLGRSSDVLTMANSGVRQEDLEEALWADGLPEPHVLNYMLVLKGDDVVCLVTTDREGDDAWNELVGRRIAPLFNGSNVAVRQVDALPPLASLGSYVGWKLSRVLDLGDPRMWERLPAPIGEVVARTLAQIEANTGLVPTAE